MVGADVGDGADVRADAGSEEAVRDLVDQVVGKHGGLDIFFANAGISGGFATIAEQTAAGLGRDPAGQPDRAVPRDQICGAR